MYSSTAMSAHTVGSAHALQQGNTRGLGDSQHPLLRRSSNMFNTGKTRLAGTESNLYSGPTSLSSTTRLRQSASTYAPAAEDHYVSRHSTTLAGGSSISGTNSLGRDFESRYDVANRGYSSTLTAGAGLRQPLAASSSSSAYNTRTAMAGSSLMSRDSRPKLSSTTKNYLDEPYISRRTSSSNLNLNLNSENMMLGPGSATKTILEKQQRLAELQAEKEQLERRQRQAMNRPSNYSSLANTVQKSKYNLYDNIGTGTVGRANGSARPNYTSQEPVSDDDMAPPAASLASRLKEVQATPVSARFGVSNAHRDTTVQRGRAQLDIEEARLRLEQQVEQQRQQMHQEYEQQKQQFIQEGQKHIQDMELNYRGELEKMQQQAQNSIQELRGLVDTRELQIKQMEFDRDSQMQNAGSITRMAQQELEHLRERCRQLERESVQYNSQLEHAVNECGQELEMRVKQLQQEHQHEIQLLQSQIKDKDGQTNLEQNTLQKQCNELREHLGETRGELAHAKDRISKLQDQLSKTEEERDTQARKTQLDTNLTKDRIENQTKDITNLQQKIENQNSQIKELELLIQNVEEERSGLAKQLKELHDVTLPARIKETETDYERRINEIQGTEASHQEEISLLRQGLREAEEMIEHERLTHRQEIDRLRSNIDNHEVDNSRIIANLEQQIRQLNQTLEQRDQQLNSYSASMEQGRQELKQMTDRINTLTSQNESTNDAGRKLEAMYNEAKVSLDFAQDKISQMEQELSNVPTLQSRMQQAENTVEEALHILQERDMRIKELESLVETTQNGQTEINQQWRSRLDNTQERLEAELKSLQQSLHEKSVRVQELTEREESYKQIVTESTGHAEQLQARFEELERTFPKRLEEETQLLIQQLRKMEEVTIELQRQLDNAIKQNGGDSLSKDMQIRSLLERIRGLESQLSMDQNNTKLSIQQEKNKRQQLIDEMASIKKELDISTRQQVRLKESLDTYKTKLEQSNGTIKEMRSENIKLITQIETIKARAL